MDAQLKGLLGKTGRPLIICGELWCIDRAPVVASVENYRTHFKVVGSDVELEPEKANNIILEKIRKFETEFSGMRPTEESIETVEVQQSVDLFTGAVLLETKLYRQLLQYDLHEPGNQLSRTQARLVRNFAVRHITNYYQIFTLLLNRRIVAQHMPLMVKCHFTKGLFQPLIVETDGIPSPLKYGENRWLYDLLRKDEVSLERREQGVRKLNLSCVAMCDIAQAFRVPVVKELDRRGFMLILSLVFLDRLDSDAMNALEQRYARTANRVAAQDSAYNLYVQMIDYSRRSRTALEVVNR